MATILVVDDDEVLQLIVTAALKKAGHQTIKVVDPREAYSVAVEHTPDAIILDVNMPVLSGWEVLRRFRDLPAFRNVPVLMLSAKDDVESRVRGLRLGANDYLTKPFANEELLARLEAHLARQERDRKGLRGDLRGHPLVEVLQGLAQNEKSGRLGIVHFHLDGWVSFDHGLLVGANFGKLTDRSAMLALLELQEGQFSFDPDATTLSHVNGQAMTVQSLALEAAWLEDELEALKSHLPEPKAILDAGSEPENIPDEFCTLPILRIWSRIRRFVDTRLIDLLSEGHGAPREVKLALAWLEKNGNVTAGEEELPNRTSRSEDDPPPANEAAAAMPATSVLSAPAEADPQNSQRIPRLALPPIQDVIGKEPIKAEISTTSRLPPEQDLEEADSALRETFQTAMSRGFSLDHLTLDWVVDEAAWTTAAQLIAQVPGSLIGEKASNHKANIITRRSGRLVLRHQSASLPLVFSQLSSGMAQKPLDPSTIGVILLWGEILSRSALTVVVAELQNHAPQDAGFLLIAQDGETASLAQSLLSKNRRWKVSRDLHTTFTSILFDLCGLEME